MFKTNIVNALGLDFLIVYLCLNRHYMKSFKRLKVINGNEYWYEITPYKDKKTNKIRQKSRYLGKNLDGKPEKVRQPSFRNVYAYGEFLPLEKIWTGYGLDAFLEKSFSKSQARSIEAMVLGRVLRGLSSVNIAPWYSSIWRSHAHPDLPLSSASISRLLTKIGEDAFQDKLLAHLVKKLKSKRSIFYDITSISSYSELVSLLEWGYNRDGESLPQINLSMLMDKQEGIPLGYEVYPGSISDVTTLNNTVKKMKVLGVKDFSLILDRGFFSKGNIELLLKHHADFVIAVPERYSSIEKMVSKLLKDKERPVHLKQYRGEAIFAQEVEITTGNLHLRGFFYFDPKRAAEEKRSFYNRLSVLKEKIEQVKPGYGAMTRIERIAGRMGRFFECDIQQEHVVANIKEKAVSRVLNRKGTFLLACQGEHDWESCLTAYRERAAVEQGFDVLKNDIELSRTYAHKNETIKGQLFIGLLALILRMKVISMLKSSGLSKTYSFEKMMLTLEKMKVTVTDNGKVFYSESTKKQREILEVFDIVPKL